MAYQSDESGQYEVYLCPFPDCRGKSQVSTDGGTEPRWNPNGRELFYRSGDRMMVVTVETHTRPNLGQPRFLFERRSPYGWYDVTPDGQRFVMVDDNEPAAAPTQLILVQNWFEELKRLVPTN